MKQKKKLKQKAKSIEEANEFVQNLLQLTPEDLGRALDISETYTIEQAWSKIAMILAQSKNLLTLTELNDAEIKRLSPLLVEQRIYNSGILEKFITGILLMRISKNRKGRVELKEIAVGLRSREEEKTKSLRRLFRGLS